MKNSELIALLKDILEIINQLQMKISDAIEEMSESEEKDLEVGLRITRGGPIREREPRKATGILENLYEINLKEDNYL